MNISAINFNSTTPNYSQIKKGNPNFDARKFPSGVFEDYEIAKAKQYVNKSGKGWVQEIKNWYLNQCEKNANAFQKDPKVSRVQFFAPI